MKHFKEEVWYPTLMDRQNIDKRKEEAMASIASVTVNLG
jgi:hypothetical protein